MDELKKAEIEAEKAEDEKPEEEEGVTLPPEGEDVSIELNNSPVPTEEQIVEGQVEGELEDGHNLNPVEPGPETEEQKAVEKLFTQSQLNEIVGQRVNETREKAHNDTIAEILETFGVDSIDALKALAGDGQRFPALQEDLANEKKSSEQRIAELEKSLGDVSSELALWKSGINPDRYEDAKLILSGKGLDITAENIKNEMLTHPEWENKPVEEPAPEMKPAFEKVENPEEKSEPVSKIARLGNVKGGSSSEEEERNTAMGLFDI